MKIALKFLNGIDSRLAYCVALLMVRFIIAERYFMV